MIRLLACSLLELRPLPERLLTTCFGSATQACRRPARQRVRDSPPPFPCVAALICMLSAARGGNTSTDDGDCINSFTDVCGTGLLSLVEAMYRVSASFDPVLCLEAKPRLHSERRVDGN